MFGGVLFVTDFALCGVVIYLLTFVWMNGDRRRFFTTHRYNSFSLIEWGNQPCTKRLKL